MRCRTILLLALTLAGFVRVAMAINDSPYYLFPYEPDAMDKPSLCYTKVCPVGKARPDQFLARHAITADTCGRIYPQTMHNLLL